MTPGMKMMMLGRAGKGQQGPERRDRTDYRTGEEPEDRGGRRMAIEYEDTRSRMEPESRSRRRYRDGRFAPSRAAEMGHGMPESRYDEPEQRWEPWWNRQSPPADNYRMGDDGNRMMGFEGNYSMTTHGSQSRMQMGHGESRDREGRHLDQHTAKQWVEKMGECFTMEETMEALKKRKCKCEPLEFWVIVNAMKSDYPKLAAKYGVDHLDFYADMAVEWLEDRDAKPGKAMRYWENIVKHE